MLRHLLKNMCEYMRADNWCVRVCGQIKIDRLVAIYRCMNSNTPLPEEGDGVLKSEKAFGSLTVTPPYNDRVATITTCWKWKIDQKNSQWLHSFLFFHSNKSEDSEHELHTTVMASAPVTGTEQLQGEHSDDHLKRPLQNAEGIYLLYEKCSFSNHQHCRKQK